MRPAVAPGSRRRDAMRCYSLRPHTLQAGPSTFPQLARELRLYATRRPLLHAARSLRLLWARTRTSRDIALQRTSRSTLPHYSDTRLTRRRRTGRRNLCNKVRPREESPMPESVYKIVELVGTSTESWEKAAATAVQRAGKSLRDLRIAEVAQLDLQIEKGKVKAYRARLKVSFKFEGD